MNIFETILKDLILAGQLAEQIIMIIDGAGNVTVINPTAAGIDAIINAHMSKVKKA